MNIFAMLPRSFSSETPGGSVLSEKIDILEKAGVLTEDALQDPRKLFEALLEKGILGENPLGENAFTKGRNSLDAETSEESETSEKTGDSADLLLSLWGISGVEKPEQTPDLHNFGKLAEGTESLDAAKRGFPDEEALLKALDSLGRIPAAEDASVPKLQDPALLSPENSGDISERSFNEEGKEILSEEEMLLNPGSREKKSSGGKLPEVLSGKAELLREEGAGRNLLSPGSLEEPGKTEGSRIQETASLSQALYEAPPIGERGLQEKETSSSSEGKHLSQLPQEAPSQKEPLSLGKEPGLVREIPLLQGEKPERGTFAQELRQAAGENASRELLGEEENSESSGGKNRGDLSQGRNPFLENSRSGSDKILDSGGSSRPKETSFDEQTAALQRQNPVGGREMQLDLKSLSPGSSGASLLPGGQSFLMEGLGQTMRIVRTFEGSRAQIIVDPPALGRIEISLQATSQGVSALLRVDNEALRQMLQGQMDLLRSSLQQQGIAVTDLSVDVRQEGGRAFSENQSGGSRGKKGIASLSGYDLEAEENLPVFRLDMEQGLLSWVA
jgi:flagellar hook-length control protein FliK